MEKQNKSNKTNLTNKTKGKILEGKVVSAKQNHTVIVEVINTYRHPIYRKAIRQMRRFAAHNELPNIVVGTKVHMQEVKPMSKTKHYLVLDSFE